MDQLKKFVKTSVMTGQLDLDSQKRQAMGLINDIEVGKKEAKEDLQSAFMEVEKYKDMVMRRSEDSGRTIAYTIFRAKNVQQRKTGFHTRWRHICAISMTHLSIRMQSVISCIRHWN